MRHFGGVPQLIVPDNPRALIANPDRYQPRTNDTVEDFARHYGCSVWPARPRLPQALVGQVLEARLTTRGVELLHRGQRVAAHARSVHRGGFTTVVAHLPAAHRAHLEWTPERLVHWGNSIGVATGRTVQRLLEERRHPEHGYRAWLGLLSLARKYAPRLEAACVVALELGTTRYAHVRGPGYYQ